MRIRKEDIIEKPYILLDWNVIKYLKTPREKYKHLDENCMEIITKIKSKYAFPFCEAHFKDLAQSYSENNKDLVNSDLEFLKNISGEIVLGMDENNKFIMTRHSVYDMFNGIISEKECKPSISPNINPQLSFNVDMEKLDINHPLKDMLQNSNGVYTPGILANWMNELFDKFFDEIDDYKKLRNYIPKLKQDIINNCGKGIDTQYEKKLLNHINPFLDSITIDDENKLATIWKDVVYEWITMKYDKNTNINPGELLTTGYSLLDLHPLFREKLKKKNKLSNIVRDSKMILYASESKYFVTEDKNSRKKAEFLF